MMEYYNWSDEGRMKGPPPSNQVCPSCTLPNGPVRKLIGGWQGEVSDTVLSILSLTSLRRRKPIFVHHICISTPVANVAVRGQAGAKNCNFDISRLHMSPSWTHVTEKVSKTLYFKKKKWLTFVCKYGMELPFSFHIVHLTQTFRDQTCKALKSHFSMRQRASSPRNRKGQPNLKHHTANHIPRNIGLEVHFKIMIFQEITSKFRCLTGGTGVMILDL